MQSTLTRPNASIVRGFRTSAPCPDRRRAPELRGECLPAEPRGTGQAAEQEPSHPVRARRRQRQRAGRPPGGNHEPVGTRSIGPDGTGTGRTVPACLRTRSWASWAGAAHSSASHSIQATRRHGARRTALTDGRCRRPARTRRRQAPRTRRSPPPASPPSPATPVLAATTRRLSGPGAQQRGKGHTERRSVKQRLGSYLSERIPSFSVHLLACLDPQRPNSPLWLRRMFPLRRQPFLLGSTLVKRA